MQNIVGNKVPDFPLKRNAIGNGGAIASRLISTFAGSQYGTLDTSITFTGDFEIEAEVAISDGIIGSFQILTGQTTTADYFGVSGVGVLSLKIAETVLSSAPVTVDPFDGKIHTWKATRVGSVGTLTIDGVVQVTGAVGAGNSTWETIGSNILPTATNFLNGQLLSIKYTDQSGSPDVITNYVFDSGSITEQFARGSSTLKVTLTNFATTDWTRYTQQKNILHDTGVIGEAWIGDSVIVNGRFDADSDWTKGADWTIAGGVATHSVGATNSLYQSALIIGLSYLLTIDITRMDAAFLRSYIGLGTFSANYTTAGIKKFFGIAATDTNVYIFADAACDADIDNVSASHILEVA